MVTGWSFLSRIAPDEVAPEVRAAVAHALDFVEATLGPEALPPDREIHWCLPGRVGPQVVGIPGHGETRGFCSKTGELWIRADIPAGGVGRIAMTAAHEAFHRHQFLVRGIPAPDMTGPRGDVEQEAADFGMRYHLLHWTPGGAEIVARMDERHARWAAEGRGE